MVLKLRYILYIDDVFFSVYNDLYPCCFCKLLELCFVVLIASCLWFGHAYIPMLLCFIECMFSWSFVLLCDHCSHFYMTVLVYDQVAHMFHIMFTWSQFTCYNRNLFVILYLSFYYLLYLEGLMCFVQVFQATSIYVPSASQLLIILKGRNFKHF